MTNKKPSKSGCLPIAIAIFVVVLLLGSYFLLRLPQGVLFPVRIAGQSMAPHLLDEHFELDCPLCGYREKIEVSSNNLTNSPACSHCSTQLPLDASTEIIPADRVIIDKSDAQQHALQRQGLQRWAVVALHDPVEPGRLIVKRIAGLPNELVRVSDGDVRIEKADATFVSYNDDGHQNTTWRLPKVLVNDDRFRTEKSESRWRNANGSLWMPVSWGHKIDCTTSELQHWLTYQHKNTHPGTRARVIYDDVPFNTSVRRPLHPVANIMVSGIADLQGGGKFWVRCRNAGQDSNSPQEVVAEFDLAAMTWHAKTISPSPSRTAELHDQVLTTRKFWFQMVRQPDFVRFTVDDLGDRGQPARKPTITRQVLHVDFEEPAGASEFSVGVSQLQARITKLKIERFPHYTTDSPLPATGTSATGTSATGASWRLGEDEFFLLGDNAPVSVDSRHWPKMIRSSDIIGIVRKKRN